MQTKIEKYLKDTSYTFYKYVNSKEVYIQDEYGVYKTTLNRLQNKQLPTSQTVIDFKQWLINKATKVHGCRFTYDIPDSCTKLKDSFIVICPSHGPFKSNYTNHIFKKNGCKSCFSTSLLKPLDYFLDKAKEVHGNDYDYTKALYKGMKIKLEIICKTHGIFMQTPDKHLQGQGCPKCSQIRSKVCGYSKTDFVESAKRSYKKPCLYIIKCYNETENFYKIGITTTSLKVRFSGKKLPYKYEVMQIIENEDASFIYDCEKFLHKQFKSFKYKPLINFDGSTECFKYV